ncbi:MAG: hypothetical protein EON93_25375, partial [Burkholderiales bacterium]
MPGPFLWTKAAALDVNPILVEQTRGGVVETIHRGSFVVCDARGTVVAAAGNVERLVFPRSA